MKLGALSLSLLGLALAAPAQARDQIRIVGSSTVFPFSTAVAEQFGKTTDFPTPVVESTGSGGGLKLFCGGVGLQHPDVTNSSRRIKASEVELCSTHGVTDIVEVKIGFDGIVIANARSTPRLSLTKEQIFRALAKKVPQDGKLVDNPYEKWSDIDPSLPATKIEVLGPPPTSGTRDAFVELAMERGADEFPAIKALKSSDKNKHKSVCQRMRTDGAFVELAMERGAASIPMLKALKDSDADAFKAAAHGIREDGAYIEAGENDNLIVQKLEANPDALGVFGFSFLDQNTDRIQGSLVEGVEPTFEAIAGGSYGVSRSLYFYVKKAHVGVVPGIEEFIAEFTSDKASGEDGYLADKGLIPLPPAEREAVRAEATKLALLSL